MHGSIENSSSEAITWQECNFHHDTTTSPHVLGSEMQRSKHRIQQVFFTSSRRCDDSLQRASECRSYRMVESMGFQVVFGERPGPQGQYARLLGNMLEESGSCDTKPVAYYQHLRDRSPTSARGPENSVRLGTDWHGLVP